MYYVLYSMIQCVNLENRKLQNKFKQTLNSPQNIHFRLTFEHVMKLFWQNMLHLGHLGCYLKFILGSDFIILIYVLSI